MQFTSEITEQFTKQHQAERAKHYTRNLALLQILGSCISVIGPPRTNGININILTVILFKQDNEAKESW